MSPDDGEARESLSVDLSQRLTSSQDVLVRELDGQAILLNLESESYYGLNEVGTRMWAVLTTSPSVGVAYQRLLEEFEVEPATLRTDLENLLDGLLESGLARLETP